MRREAISFSETDTADTPFAMILACQSFPNPAIPEKEASSWSLSNAKDSCETQFPLSFFPNATLFERVRARNHPHSTRCGSGKGGVFYAGEPKGPLLRAARDAPQSRQGRGLSLRDPGGANATCRVSPARAGPRD